MQQTVIVTESTSYYNTNQADVISTNTRWRYQPQILSLKPATLIFMAGGMDLALGLGWNRYTGILTTNQFQFSWFIGVIVGAVLAAPLIHFFPKRIHYTISSLLVLASGIIYVSVPHEYDPIIAARYVSGVGVGLCTVAFIVHGSEIGAPACRGSLLSLEQCAISFGIAIQVIYAAEWGPDMDFSANRVHGIFLIIFAVIAFALNYYYVIESPIFYLRKANDETALDCLRLLERPQLVTNSTKAAFEDLQNYVIQETNQSFMESFRKSILPLAKMLLYRSVVALTFSLPLSWALIFSSFIGLNDIYNWTPIVYGVLRLVGASLAIWMMDNSGRKFLSLVSLFCIAGLTIGYCVIFHENVFDSYRMSINVTLMLIAQFFGGLFTTSSTVYLGEAFSLNLKPYLIALCVSVQQVVHIITIVTFTNPMDNEFVYFISTCCIMFVLCIFFGLTMPETRKTTLREAQDRFRPLYYLKMY